jgi:uncharacterized membrane protein YbhN (UPF0104 family)
LWAVKFTIGVALLAFFALRVDVEALWRALLVGSPALYALALGCFALSRLAEAVRLRFLLSREQAPLVRVVEMTTKATFFNNFSLLVVGEGYRAHWIKQWTHDWDRAISLLLVDRAVGLLVVAGLALVYLVFGKSVLDLASRLDVRLGSSVGLTLLGALAIVAALAVVFRGHVVRASRRLLLWFARFRVLLADLPARAWVGAAGASVTAQVAVTAMTLVLVIAFGETMPFLDVLFVMVLVYLTAFVPVSIGALGVREGILILGLPLFGPTVQAATSVALASRAVMYLVALGGGVWLLLGRAAPHPVPSARPPFRGSSG